MKQFWREFNDNLYIDHLIKMGLLPRLFFAVLFVLVAWLVGTFINKMFKSRFSKKLDDPMLPIFFANILRIVMVLIGFVFALQILKMGDLAKSLLAGAGITAFVIGFALKDIGENFLSGILLASKKPFRVGDLIECNGVKGNVTALNLRDTEIKTADGKDVLMPNSILIKNPLMNYTIDGSHRYEFIVKINYGEVVSLSKQILENVMQEIMENEKAMFNVSVQLEDISQDGYQFKIFYWINTTKPHLPSGQIQSMAMINIIEELSKNNIQIQRTSISISK
ncbi:MAG: mechanosensitive ion channel family protein [Chitinophagaceae bacterium]|nr:MAG: mechanosensitive ion channel MscS [Bacteroidetes bacterium OLB11]MCC6448082.1 mechanosensitive ion channel family protein [Chitinophagaceae bacterium]HMN31848.1 mechanosensitive ion channel family protein [Chitinophagaceae bacterium]